MTTIKTDKQLLELAAKAAGYKWDWYGCSFHISIDGKRYTSWNPLTDDGDALRLAVKLGLTFHSSMTAVLAGVEGSFGCEENFDAHNEDQYAATRRAIVRAAAEIGKTL